LALLAGVLAGCAHAPAVVPSRAAEAPFREQGLASFYANALAGRLTANGERYQPEALTAAHRSLPFGTHVRVTARQSGRSVVVRINDRGPFVAGRIIDLSNAAARRIGLLDVGVLEFAIESIPANTLAAD
jgi:rare lipoprotein A